MSKQSVAIRVIFVVLLAESLSVALPVLPCRGSDRASADPTITLEVQNEPLRSVLGKISKTTGWKITAPDKWLDKPVTQTLSQVSLEVGLRFILRDAGMENLLMTYDEERKTITVYDAESQKGQPLNNPPAYGVVRPPVFSASDQPDPVLTRAAKDAGSRTPRGTSRARSKKRAYREEE